MKQNKIPRNEYIIQPKGKTNPYKDDVIYSDLGQWKYPGQVTRIPSNQITMQGVNYPVQGVDDTGYSQMMYPGMDYQFPGQYVTEYPIANAMYGGDPSLNNIEGHYQDGGFNNYEADLISKVLMNRNRNKDFVKRAYDVGAYPDSNMFTRPDDNKFGEKNSHLMGWGEDESGQAWMYPNVMNPTNEAIKVPNQYADYISSEGYKKATGMIPKKPFGGQNTKTHTHMKGGGSLNRKVTCSSCGWSWKLVDGGTDPMTCHKCGGTIKMQNGGWLDSMQGGGDNGIDMSKVRMDFHPKSQIEAQEQLDYEKNYELEWKKQQAENKKKNIAAAVKMGVPKKEAEAIELSQENPRDQGEIRQHIPQTNLSKAVEIAANPVTAMEDYVRSGYNRLPDHFSSNPDRDMLSPTEIANMGYQFLTPMGRTAWALQSADNVDDDIKAGDYTGAVIDAAFALPGLRVGKKFAQTLNKLNRVKNINNIRKAKNAFTFNPEVLKAQQQGLQKAKKIISHPTGKMEGLGSAKDAAPKNSKYPFNYGELATPVYEGKFPQQSPSGNIKGDLFDLTRTGYTDVPGFNKQIQNLKTQAEFGKRPLGKNVKTNPATSKNALMEALDNARYEEGITNLIPTQYMKQAKIPYNAKKSFQNIQPNKYGGEGLEDEYRRGGQKRKRYTSKNIQSSINDLFRRNETLFGPAGRKNYKPGLKYKSGGNWLDNLT